MRKFLMPLSSLWHRQPTMSTLALNLASHLTSSSTDKVLQFLPQQGVMSPLMRSEHLASIELQTQ